MSETLPSVQGGDVSSWDNNISTPQVVDFVKAREAGWRFVFIKASQALWGDRDIVLNWKNAKLAGLLRGAYHFLTWDVSPTAQAEWFWSLIKDDPGELPPVVDFEWWSSSIPTDALDRLYAFLVRLEELCGKPPIIYTGPAFWIEHGNWLDLWKRYPLWIAHYTEAGEPLVPLPWTTWTFWQYTSHGPGLLYGTESLDVDLNRYNGTLAQLYAFAGVQLPVDPGTMTHKQFVPMVTGDGTAGEGA